MRKKIIGILICGIFLMTSLSALTTSTKAKSVLELSGTQDILYKNKIKTAPSKIQNNPIPVFHMTYVICTGHFSVNNNTVYGHADKIVTFEYYIFPSVYYNENITLPIKISSDPSIILWKVRYSNTKVTWNFIGWS